VLLTYDLRTLPSEQSAPSERSSGCVIPKTGLPLARYDDTRRGVNDTPRGPDLDLPGLNLDSRLSPPRKWALVTDLPGVSLPFGPTFRGIGIGVGIRVRVEDGKGTHGGADLAGRSARCGIGGRGGGRGGPVWITVGWIVVGRIVVGWAGVNRP